MTSCSRSLPAVALAVSLTSSIAWTARADDTIKRPNDHPAYHVEAEPHLLLGWDNVYGSGGFGVGGRFSIPIVFNGFVESINNSVAVGFGLDWVHYDSCYWKGSCAGDYLWFPVVMQWNFYVAQRFSVFGEPGLTFFHGTYDACTDKNGCPGDPRRNGIEPAIYIGGRYHLSERTALTLRVGFPAFSFGFSFFP